MEITAFDTHDFVKRLTEVGMPEAQAEILAEEQSRLIKERLATKQDIKAMEVAIMELRRDIKELEDRLKRDMMELKRDLRELEDRLKRDMMGLKRDLKGRPKDRPQTRPQGNGTKTDHQARRDHGYRRQRFGGTR